MSDSDSKKADTYKQILQKTIEVTEEEKKRFEELLERFCADKEKQTDEQRKKWLAYARERREMEARAREWDAYWERRKTEDRDLWRDKDFANAVDKNSRGGYKGKHGDFDYPDEEKRKLEAFYMQATVGDFDGNNRIPCAELWKTHKGMDRITAQREFIKLTNWCLTRWGWNPPSGWR